jgi:chromate transporter
MMQLIFAVKNKNGVLKKMKNLKLLLNIYLTFLKLGSVSFGGGYAMLSLMQLEIVEKKKWVDKEKIIDIFAVGESLPGAIALNSSAFVGYAIAGVPGAICALLGNLTPSLFIMVVLSVLFKEFGENTYVMNAFKGIRPVIVGLILYAAFKIGKSAIKNWLCVIVTCLALGLSIFIHVEVMHIILAGIVTGILLHVTKKLHALPIPGKESVFK